MKSKSKLAILRTHLFKNHTVSTPIKRTIFVIILGN